MEKLRNNILDISHNHYDYLMNLENVKGVGLGYKWINEMNTKEPCIHVLVENKIPKEYLTKTNIVPKSFMGIKTDIIEIGSIKNFNGPPSDKFPGKFRPLEGGISISPYNYPLGEGTLGCIVTKVVKEEKNFYGLSNNHVLVLFNTIKLGTSIVQPAEDLGGEYEDSIGTLSNFIRHQFISYRGKPINLVDCALVKLNNQQLVTNKIKEIGEVKGVSKPELDLHVRKCGFVSGLTEGKITTIGLTINIDTLPIFGGRTETVHYQDQIATTVFSTGGDSGSVVVNDDNEVVGLLFAGDDRAGTSLCNDINIVIEKLKIQIYTGK